MGNAVFFFLSHIRSAARVIIVNLSAANENERNPASNFCKFI